MKISTRIYFAVLLSLTVTALSCVPMPGQRLLNVQIELEGTVIFEGIRDVPDSTPVVEMFDVLGDIPFESIANEGNALDDDEKNIRVLEGAIVVRIEHVNNELARATLKRITLRSHDAEATWTLDDAEVERIKVSAEY